MPTKFRPGCSAQPLRTASATGPHNAAPVRWLTSDSLDIGWRTSEAYLPPPTRDRRVEREARAIARKISWGKHTKCLYASRDEFVVVKAHTDQAALREAEWLRGRSDLGLVGVYHPDAPIDQVLDDLNTHRRELRELRQAMRNADVKTY